MLLESSQRAAPYISYNNKTLSLRSEVSRIENETMVGLSLLIKRLKVAQGDLDQPKSGTEDNKGIVGQDLI